MLSWLFLRICIPNNCFSFFKITFRTQNYDYAISSTQCLSGGVADNIAIELLDKISTKGFKNSLAAIEFFRTIDRLFILLNSLNPFGKGFTAPIRLKTIKYFDEVFSDIEQYLKSIKIYGINILSHNKETFA